MYYYLRVLAILITILNIPSNLEAAYIVTGQVKGEVCEGWNDYTCRLVNVTAASGDNGKGLYDPRSIYHAVSDYNKKEKICHVKIRASSRKLSGLLSDINRAFFKRTKFYEKRLNGAYYEVDTRKLLFPCRIK
jgi:hypothetical protein